jgi:hypothetical protein
MSILAHADNPLLEQVGFNVCNSLWGNVWFNIWQHVGEQTAAATDYRVKHKAWINLEDNVGGTIGTNVKLFAEKEL